MGPRGEAYRLATAGLTIALLGGCASQGAVEQPDVVASQGVEPQGDTQGEQVSNTETPKASESQQQEADSTLPTTEELYAKYPELKGYESMSVDDFMNPNADSAGIDERGRQYLELLQAKYGVQFEKANPRKDSAKDVLEKHWYNQSLLNQIQEQSSDDAAKGAVGFAVYDPTEDIYGNFTGVGMQERDENAYLSGQVVQYTSGQPMVLPENIHILTKTKQSSGERQIAYSYTLPGVDGILLKYDHQFTTEKMGDSQVWVIAKEGVGICNQDNVKC